MNVQRFSKFVEPARQRLGWFLLAAFTSWTYLWPHHGDYKIWFTVQILSTATLAFLWRLKPFWFWAGLPIAFEAFYAVKDIVTAHWSSAKVAVSGIALPTPPGHSFESQTLYWTQLTFFATSIGAVLSVVAIYVTIGLLFVAWLEHRRASRRPRLAVEFGTPGKFGEKRTISYEASTATAEPSEDNALFRVETPPIYIRNSGNMAATKPVLVIFLPADVRPIAKVGMNTPSTTEACHAAEHFAFECRATTLDGHYQDYWDLPHDIPPDTRTDLAPLRLFVPVGVTRVLCQVTCYELGSSWTNEYLSIVLTRERSARVPVLPSVQHDVTLVDERASRDKGAAANVGLMKAGDVVKRVRATFPGFNQYSHRLAYLRFDVRPPRAAANPARTDPRYCMYDAAHKDYLYTDAWIEKLLHEMDADSAGVHDDG